MKSVYIKFEHNGSIECYLVTGVQADRYDTTIYFAKSASREQANGIKISKLCAYKYERIVQMIFTGENIDLNKILNDNEEIRLLVD